MLEVSGFIPIIPDRFWRIVWDCWNHPVNMRVLGIAAVAMPSLDDVTAKKHFPFLLIVGRIDVFVYWVLLQGLASTEFPR
jgi:hypothetical protein